MINCLQFDFLLPFETCRMLILHLSITAGSQRWLFMSRTLYQQTNGNMVIPLLNVSDESTFKVVTPGMKLWTYVLQCLTKTVYVMGRFRISPWIYVWSGIKRSMIYLFCIMGSLNADDTFCVVLGSNDSYSSDCNKRKVNTVNPPRICSLHVYVCPRVR